MFFLLFIFWGVYLYAHITAATYTQNKIRFQRQYYKSQIIVQNTIFDPYYLSSFFSGTVRLLYNTVQVFVVDFSDVGVYSIQLKRIVKITSFNLVQIFFTTYHCKNNPDCGNIHTYIYAVCVLPFSYVT